MKLNVKSREGITCSCHPSWAGKEVCAVAFNFSFCNFDVFAAHKTKKEKIEGCPNSDGLEWIRSSAATFKVKVKCCKQKFRLIRNEAKICLVISFCHRLFQIAAHTACKPPSKTFPTTRKKKGCSPLSWIAVKDCLSLAKCHSSL